ncbi:MAG: lipid IV(A) 3-deoxy-D-manno-octulosonic acid transferase [Oleibacter sp.]|nr:lipid IV(A) 3-deoxy-D-manno-octulosonic acid transferase [Thalassolituus sp.]
MSRSIYTLLYACLLPVMLMRLWWRGRTNPGYRQRIFERFGRIPHRPQPGGLWLHAVSMGETLASVPLVNAFIKQHPDVPVIITTTTPTGSEQVKKQFGSRVYHMYMPYDLPWFLERLIRSIRPSLLVIMETEMWPNLLACCEKNHIPVVLANARLSEKSAAGYAKLTKITPAMMSSFTKIAAQYESDGERFVTLGLDPKKLAVIGSIKFDAHVPPGSEEKGMILRKEWGESRTVLALASSHPGEDERVLALYPALSKVCPDLLLLLVPRHPERFEGVTNAAHNQHLRVHRRNQGPATSAVQVYVADTMGEMFTLLAAADLVLMGGSLEKHGGHNPIEPAALGKPTLIGPNYLNFSTIVDNLVAEDALAVVDNVDNLEAALSNWLTSTEQRIAMGNKAKHVVDANKGSVERLLALINKHLDARKRARSVY